MSLPSSFHPAPIPPNIRGGRAEKDKHPAESDGDAVDFRWFSSFSVGGIYNKFRKDTHFRMGGEVC